MTSTMIKNPQRNGRLNGAKNWEVILYSGLVVAGSSGINAYQFSNKEKSIIAIRTAGILSINELDIGVNMINTGPCRYIALHTGAYNSTTSSVVVAYSNQIPVDGISLAVNAVFKTNNTPTTLIRKVLEIENSKQLTSSLYYMKKGDKLYFIVVD